MNRSKSGVLSRPTTKEACSAIQDGSSLDVVEMDAATHRGIAEIRELRDNVGLAPSQLRTKVYIVDEVHMLSRSAFNAFLKTLEAWWDKHLPAIEALASTSR